MLTIEDLNTQLFLAVFKEQLSEVAALISRGADLNYIPTPEDFFINAPTIDMHDTNLTPLMLVAINGNEEIFNLLMEHPVDIHLTNEDGFDALHYAAGNSHYRIIEKLIDLGTNVNHQNKLGVTALMNACMFKNNNKVITLLIKNGALINMTSPINGSAIFLSVSAGNQSAVTLLLKAGANINDVSNQNALVHAAINEDFGIVKILVKAGSAIENINKALTAAIFSKNFNIIKFLLKSGAKINFINPAFKTGNTPLMQAILIGSGPKIINEFFRYKPDLDMANINGETALILAASSQIDEVTIVNLIQRGADVNKVDTNGMSALSIAADDGNTDVIIAILKHAIHAIPDAELNESLSFAIDGNRNESAAIISKALLDKVSSHSIEASQAQGEIPPIKRARL